MEFFLCPQPRNGISFLLFSYFCQIILTSSIYKSVKTKQCCSIDSHRDWELTNTCWKADCQVEVTDKTNYNMQMRKHSLYNLIKKDTFFKSAVQNWFSSWMNPMKFQILWSSLWLSYLDDTIYFCSAQFFLF